MRFFMKRLDNGEPHLESDDRIFSIIFAESTDKFECVLADTGDVLFSYDSLEETIHEANKKLLSEVKVSTKEMKLMKAYYESLKSVKSKRDLKETKITNAKDVKKQAQKLLHSGGSIEFDSVSMQIDISYPSGKKIVLKKREVENLIDEFDSHPISQDITLDFEDYVLVKYM